MHQIARMMMPHDKAVVHTKASYIQSRLLESIVKEDEPALSKAQCSRAWLEIEYAKREWRGIARLKPLDMSDALNRMKRAQRAKPIAITEAPSTKESLYPPPPVPTPPTPDPK